MGLDSYYSKKSLEQRARENNTAVDMQWIKENEYNELYKSSLQNGTSGMSSFPGGLDKDIQEYIEEQIRKIEER